MNLIAKTFGALALSILALAAVVVIVALALWLLVPAALPVSITFGQALALSGLLYVVKAVFIK